MFVMSSKRALIESARTEILLYDKEGARVDRIAERAGVNKRMIYHHFGSKEGVYQAILQRQLYLLSVASGPMPNILRLVCDSYLSEIGNAWVEKQIFQQAELSATAEDFRVATIICLRAFLSLETRGSMESSKTLIFIKDVSPEERADLFAAMMNLVFKDETESSLVFRSKTSKSSNDPEQKPTAKVMHQVMARSRPA